MRVRRPRIGIYVLAVFSLVLIGAAVGADVDAQPSRYLDGELPVLIDPTVGRDVHDIASSTDRFRVMPLNEVGPLAGLSAIWVQLQPRSAGRDFELLLEGQRYQFATLYLRTSAQGYQPVYAREVPSPADDGRRRSVFRLPASAAGDAPAYLRVVAQSDPALALTLWDSRAFALDEPGSGTIDPTLGLLVVVALTALITGLLWRQFVLLELAAISAVLLLTLLYASGAAYRSGALAWFGLNAQAQIALSALALLLGWRYTLRAVVPRHDGFALYVVSGGTHALLIGLMLASLAVDAVSAPWVAQATVVAGYLTAALAFAVATATALGGRREAIFVGCAWAWFALFFGLRQLGAFGATVFAEHSLHVAIAGAMVLLVVGYIDRAMSVRVKFASQVREQEREADMLRVERSRRDFADSVAQLLRTLDPGLYEETILQRFLQHLSGMVPFAAAAVAVSHRGDVRLSVHGQPTALDAFESILATREQLLQSVCLSDRAAVIHSDDLGVNPASDSASCLGIVPIKADRNEWAGVLLARSGELEFGIDELELVGDFAHQAYAALLNAQQFSKVRRQAETDALTGIFNRRALLARGLRAFRKARSLRLSLSVLFVDIDHFKGINDRWGHAVGDRALKRVAELCSESLREDDFLGRYGGEEFLAVLPGATASDAEHVAERLRVAVEQNDIAIDGDTLKLTVSVGIAEMSAAFEDFDAMLRAADRALYRAKRDGRNRVVHHQFELRGDRIKKPLG